MSEVGKALRYEFLNEWLDKASKEDIIHKLIENDERAKRIKELEEIEKEHQKINGELQEKIKELEKENKKYTIKMSDEQYKKIIDLTQKDIKEELMEE